MVRTGSRSLGGCVPPGNMFEIWIALARLNADLLALAARVAGLDGIAGPQCQPDLITLHLDRMPSSSDELRRAYRLVARVTHPDVGGGSQEAFLAVSGAFERLSQRMRSRAV
jgi:hypothetical protein